MSTSEPKPVERDDLRAAFVKALSEAARTHPCPISGPYWTGCVHYDDAGRIVGVGSCHSERRADAVLAVRDVELERLRARVAELEAATYVAPSPSCTRCYGADAVRFVAQGGATAACPVCSPSELEPERRSTNAADRSADKLTALFAPVQSLREDPHDGPLHHDYRVGRDLPELGGA